MSTPIRWLHLSDFHVGKDDYATRKMFDYIIAHVQKRKAEGFVPDFLFLTGDLANRGLGNEYADFWLEFVLPLQEVIGGNIGNCTFAVPGNHDIDRTKHPAFSQDDIAKSDSQYLEPTDDGARLRQEMLIPRFSSFIENDLSPSKGAFATSDGAFAHMTTIHGHEVGIVGINTAWLSKDDKDEHKLTPGKPLLEKALNTIQPAKLRIVLGHHPVDWFRTDQQKPIKSLLGQHQVLYLHGHLHDAWAEPTYGGGQSFLAIQSGAGFQLREGEKWRNGLVWGEVNLAAEKVQLQPWHWIAEQQAWVLATDTFHENHRQQEWWHYPLPDKQNTKTDYVPATPKAQPPKGWRIFNSKDLSAHCAPLTPEDALRFFDGAVPDWSTALSSSIPRRQIVDRLASTFQNAETYDGSIVTLLLAAGCEGKTTALLQSAYSVIKSRDDWRILQRRDESQPISKGELLPVLDKEHYWLLLLDESDRAASDLLTLLQQLPLELHGKVHCLLACRDSDWLASGADNVTWSNSVDFYKERMTGLDKVDALSIVHAWQAYGDAGLGDLAGVAVEERAAALEKKATEEAKTTSGAFFGALLSVRNGTDLRKHARLMLERLGQRNIRSGGTLRDALAYIAAMHAEGLEFLSRPVLAHALGCPLERLHREVLVPLGQEAAATTTSSFIYTRHRRIAETLVSVLEQEFGEDIGQLYVRLGASAIVTFMEGGYVPELGSWRFNLSDHFFDKEQQELAFNIAQAILDCEPMNSLTRTHVANLYRKAKEPEHAIRLFRELTSLVDRDRAFYYEWGVAEGECDHQENNIILAAYSLSDQCHRSVDNNQAKKILAGLGAAFGALYDAYNNTAFRDARMAIVVLGLTLRLDTISEGYFQKHAHETAQQGAVTPDIDHAFKLLQAGIIVAEKIGIEISLTALLPKAQELTFEGLKQLIQGATSQQLFK